MLRTDFRRPSGRLVPMLCGLVALNAAAQPPADAVGGSAAGGAAPPAATARQAAETGTEAEAAARDAVAALHGAIVDAARAGKTAAERYERLLPVVRETHDLDFIAELTIRRQWRELDPEQRNAFAAAFERLSVATYAARFAAAGPETFRMLGAKSLDDGRVEVNAEVVRKDAANVPLDYVLQRGDSGWQIVNIVADGVSDLALKRAQYQQVFRDGGTIDDLIALLADEASAL